MSEENQHRLPRHVRPSSYDLTVRAPSGAEGFSGSVTIDITVDEPTNEVVCNSSDLVIEGLVLRPKAATPDATSSDAIETTHRCDASTERLIITSRTQLAAGEYVLEISFNGRYSESLVGMYRSTFDNDGVSEEMLVTQFEAPYARRVFPCWDEPEFKATFQIAIECSPGMLVISNGPEISRQEIDDNLVRFEFEPTMKMSTYLVAWVIGDLELSETVTGGSTEIRIAHRPGQGHLTSFALECAAHAVAWFEQYYGIEYPGQKLDLIAVPDFAFGAMENLGCVTFREVLLLVDPELASRSEQERAATVIEHEIAHMWFGDLVTMKWWDGIWLNEAFATFMEFCCADSFRPQWDVWTSFGLSRSAAFDTDALRSTRPIQYEVATPAEAEGMFDILTYEKGASVLRMFEQWAGPDAFRDGVRSYLQRHEYANTDTSDLWNALSEACDVDVERLMDTWILQGGHPIVHVDATPNGLRISQSPSRFHSDTSLDGTTSSEVHANPGAAHETVQRWIVPVRLRITDAGHTTERSVLLDGESLDLDLGHTPERVIANADFVGFFRTAYDAELSAALLDRVDILQPAERYGLVDDAWALFLSGVRPITDVLTTLHRVAAVETDPSVWRRIASVLSGIRTLTPPDMRASLASFTRSVVGDRLVELTRQIDAADATGITPSASERETQGVLYRLAGTIGADETVRADASRRFAATLATSSDERRGNAELDAAVIDVVAVTGSAAEFDVMADMFRSAPTSQEIMRALNALSQFPDPALMDRFCTMCLDEVRTQNAPFALFQAMSNPAIGVQVWEFISHGWDDLSERFPSGLIERMVGGIKSLSDPVVAAEIEAFFATHPLPNTPLQLAQHLERLRVNVAARGRLTDTLGSSFDEFAPNTVRP